ncbi:MAG: hypothetical protein IV101_07890 [Dechloromonas sp.]|nr:hypothetical protein [Dechloromonas sp.]
MLIREVLSEHQRQWDKELQQYPVPVVSGYPKYQHIIDMRRRYGEQIENLKKYRESDVLNFAIHGDDIILALKEVLDPVKESLLKATEADRKACAHYAKSNRFLSESKWIDEQPNYD